MAKINQAKKNNAFLIYQDLASKIELMNLMDHMAKNCLKPKDSIIPNNERQFYEICFNKIIKPAWYLASLFPFGIEGPVLVASYGLLLEEKVYNYSSLMV